MSLYLPSSESSFELPPAGMHPAICYRLIDLGTQDFPYQGTPNIGRYLLVNWELPNAKMADGRPFIIGKRWKYSGHEKANMRKDLEAWRGLKFKDSDFGPQGFDITKIVGVKAMLNIQIAEKDGTEYANIVGIGPMMKGLEISSRTNDLALLVLEKGVFNQAVYDSLSEKLKDRIAKSPEYYDLKHPKTGEQNAGVVARPDLDDEIPF